MSIEYITRAVVSELVEERKRDGMSEFGCSYAFIKMYSIKNFAKITQIPF